MDVSKLTENVKGKIAGASELLGGLKDDAKEKFINYVNGLGDILPVVAETGYRLKGIDMEMSIPPGVDMHFEKFKNVSKENIDKILEANKDKDLLRSLVKALVAADEFHNRLKIGGLKLTDLSVNLSIPPKVTIKFVKEKD
ncbi:MAG TPA: hypothetical protein VMH23_19855 [Bacteroidota bacterium]|nr:hypothetical protein [Bacteroidota bacterium]